MAFNRRARNFDTLILRRMLTNAHRRAGAACFDFFLEVMGDMEHWNDFDRRSFECHLTDKASLLYGRDVRVKIRRAGERRYNREHMAMVKLNGENIDEAAERLADELLMPVVYVNEVSPRKYSYEYGRQIYGRYIDEVIAQALVHGDAATTHAYTLGDWQLRGRYLGIFDPPGDEIRRLFSGR